MSTLDALYGDLIRNPDDWQTRSVLGDWYEDNAPEHVIACVRWMLSQRKRPYRSSSNTFCWFNIERVTTTSDPESDLPETLYQCLTKEETIEQVFRRYPTLREAEEDLFEAWVKAKDRGWDPTTLPQNAP